MKTRFASSAHEILFAHIAGVSRASLFVDTPLLSDFDACRWQALSDRLEAGEPLHYLIGYRPFYDCDIPVDERVLIPRQETELLVDAVIAWVKKSKIAQPRILDLGTGSGCIAVALARVLPHAQITASDLSASAIARAQETISAFGLTDRITCVQGDLLAPFHNTFFDCIVTNLPYIGTRSHRFVEKNVRRFEPSTALFSGVDGLELYRRFFAELKGVQFPPRIVFGEFGDTQKNDLHTLINPEWRVQFYKDFAGLDRYFSLQFSYD